MPFCCHDPGSLSSLRRIKILFCPLHPRPQIFLFLSPLHESKTPRLPPLQPQQCEGAFVPAAGSFLLRLSPCPCTGPRAALLLEIVRSWWIQATGLLSCAKCRERSLSSLQPRGQVLPVGLLTKRGPPAPPWSPCFLPCGEGGGDGNPGQLPLRPLPGWFGAQPRGSHWPDPVLPKASLSSLLVSMKNASVIAPDGTPTNLDRQLRPTHFQGLDLTSVLFPLLPI